LTGNNGGPTEKLRHEAPEVVQSDEKEEKARVGVGPCAFSVAGGKLIEASVRVRASVTSTTWALAP